MREPVAFRDPEDIYRWRKEFHLTMAEVAREVGVHAVTAELVLSKRHIKSDTYDRYFAGLQRVVNKKRDLYNEAADVLAEHDR